MMICSESNESCEAIAEAVYELIPKNDVIAPPLTSKILKQMLIKSSEWFRQMVTTKSPFKPIFISNLYSSGRPLYSWPGIKRPIKLIKGQKYVGRVTVCADPNAIFTLSEINGALTSYGQSYYVEPTSINVVSFKALKAPIKSGAPFKLVFKTPTLISVKHMMPPPLLGKGLPNLYKLVPTPSMIFAYLTRLWNAVAPPAHRIPNKSASNWSAYVVGRLADLVITEIDYWIRPATAIVGKDDSGVIREARGFIGWVLYKINRAPEKLTLTYAKLLALAGKLGIGRSRGVGLGDVHLIADATNTTKNKTQEDHRKGLKNH